MGDDPATSALDDQHELRGHPGIFVTDGSAVPTSLCVNPSLTVAAVAERASALLLRRGGGHRGTGTSRVPLPRATHTIRRRPCPPPPPRPPQKRGRAPPGRGRPRGGGRVR